LLLGFQLRHIENIAEHAEIVPPRQLAEFGDRAGNVMRGLVRSAVTGRVVLAIVDRNLNTPFGDSQHNTTIDVLYTTIWCNSAEDLSVAS
jgi:hypothetical protein